MTFFVAIDISGLRHRIAGTCAAFLAVLALSGCGNLTAGGFGEARVVASGDAPDAEPSSASAAILSSPLRSDDDDDDDDVDDPEGEIDLEFRLYLESANGLLFDLANRILEVELDLDGTVEADVVTARVPANSYRALRIEFVDIEVEVDSGVIIDGDTIRGPVDIELEDLTVTRAFNLEVLDGSLVEILVDFNARTWLRAIDTATQTVDAAAFAEAISVGLR